MSLIERVAQAIHEAEREWASTPGRAWEDCREITRDMRRACARAALEAVDQEAVDPDDPKVIETLARVIENRHGTLLGIGDTLREALAEIKRGQSDG